MSAKPLLIDLTLADFALKLSEKSPTPGGGSQAAFLAASGCALVAMALRFTSGEKYKDVELYQQGRADELDLLRARALELVDEDSAAYDAVSAALALPKATQEQKDARKAAMQQALQGALELPLETMELALAGLRIADVAAPRANKNLASDLCSGALSLWAGLEAAHCNVAINAAGIQDKAWVELRTSTAAALRREAGEALERVRACFAGTLA